MPVTAFQNRVYECIKQIPKGKVVTYKQVAVAIGCNSPRAVGQALKVNPFCPVVPCHRVIASNLTIGGFLGAAEGEKITEKLKLLAAEGVQFHNAKLLNPSTVFSFPT